MNKERDCFPLRYNLQKSGYDFPENIRVYAAIFGTEEKRIAALLAQYEQINRRSAAEIARRYDSGKLKKIFAGRTLLFMGDSITSERLSYSKIAARILPCKLYDGAVSGSRSADVLVRLAPLLFRYQPDLVSVMVGTNDILCPDKRLPHPATSKTEFMRNLHLIAETVQRSGAKLILHSIPPVFPGKYSQNNKLGWTDSKIHDDYNRIVSECAGKYAAVWNDMLEIFTKYPPEKIVESDGIHLSPFAQRLQAENFVGALVKYLSDSSIESTSFLN